MLVDFSAPVAASPAEVEAAAVSAELLGYDGFGAAETKHDVFTALTLAARATERISLQSGIAVAFARNPMTVAILANDLQLISGGRFRLGLGSQVKPHIERRFAMPWGRPAARMEEFVAALRAIWHTWATGERLMFRGEFYRHTLMTEFFDPGPNPHGNPPVELAAVGERMTAVAGRVADGLLVHPLSSVAYLAEKLVPALREARGGALDGFQLGLAAMVVLGADEAERSRAEQAVRRQIAFYASTPAYRGVLDLHGWGALADRLNALSRRQDWTAMAAEITDEVLDTFAVAGDPAAVAAGLVERFGATIDRISLYTPYEADRHQLAAVRGALRAAA
ncbi:F420-dependent oxidoreductase [Actinoplanes sp. SE50]|uniref:TIGR03617 family F420-dependent LLM class oxidoreductase n=1 Tax=unclassified Actinoplanes TaxID=2626549 RepID=UPI00023ED5B3|nr:MULTISPECIES: TIGR03617 family F420-dependent LLM class oxidoreductase [unclassified Actinoplanes]AEV83386.1 5,10-methylenetetrahydromethanopterin reductase [Actinoplanes sp. SE50/110]ATO81779.1 F420-dependent oxidoreductase [Actinoplanes sp. SE50]SLL99187.1 LLM class F420-dependent oxidoreductase [Actinoplanes sp. SE50/110]